MTTDTTALTERIEVSAREVMSRSALIADVDLPAYLAAAVLPIVEAEVRKAKAEALREAAEYIDGEEPHHLGDSDLDPLEYNTLGEYGIDRAAEWLRARATEHETGDQT